MELDDVKALWKGQSEHLESSLRFNSLLFNQANLQRTENSMRNFSRALTLEMILLFTILTAVGSFAADHFSELKYFVPAAGLQLYALAMFISGIRQLVLIAKIDYDEPVVSLQRNLETLRVVRITLTKWLLFFAPLMWVPLSIVVCRAFGLDVYQFVSPVYLAVNVLFGVTVLAAAVWASNRFAARLSGNPVVQRLMSTLAGSDLQSALDFIDTVNRFEAAP
ncbi:MAG: hypothetical protein M3Y21_05615 [Candidatus Eremiobacteraeota bacterium]|nr:hypothetical protein [Candidatus Eremiobacteraeota bacterium]